METYGVLCKTGSCNVITLNLNRIIQDWCKSIGGVPTVCNQHDSLKLYLINILERVYKYHIAYKTLLYEEEKRGMLTASNAGYISMKDLFSTIGLNGLNEAAEFLGIKCNYNSEYKDFCNLILGTISEQNKLHSTKEFKFNTEIVPAEQLGSRNYNWDKADGYKVPENRVIFICRKIIQYLFLINLNCTVENLLLIVMAEWGCIVISILI